MNNYKSFFLSLITFLLLFLVIHFLHLNLFFNAHIGLLLFLDIIFAVILGNFLLFRFKQITIFVQFVAALCASLIAAIYSVVIPIMVDRSLTVDMLMRMYNSKDKKISVSELRNLSIDNALELRLLEQKNNGIIKIDSDQISLTAKGKTIAKIFIFNNRFLKIRNLKK